MSEVRAVPPVLRFAAAAAAANFTRRIDWYGVTAASDTVLSPKESV